MQTRSLPQRGNCGTLPAMKKLINIHPSPAMHWVGNGFPVRSVFDYNSFGAAVSPFLLLDYAAPYTFAPGSEKRGVGAHPHRGFETVTITYAGELEHRDSSGGGGVIGPGDVQWMTAASGIIHEEFHTSAFTRTGGPFEMVQLWVNLPAKDKNAPAGYQTLLAADIPSVTLGAGTGSLRVIAGGYEGARGPARTFTPIDLWDIRLNAGADVTLPLTDGHTLLVLVLSGEVRANDSAETASAGNLLEFGRTGHSVRLRASADSKVLLLGGEPINEPVVGHGPFVMNTRAEILQAFKDYQEGAMGDLG